MRLLFLDIDGVLNTHEFDPEVLSGTLHRDKVILLNEVLRETEAKLVISSAWRYLIHRREMNLTGFEWLLRSHGIIAGRLVGITRPDTTRQQTDYDGRPETWVQVNERGDQIGDYLKETKHSGYAVVDDLDLGISTSGHPFVRTDGNIGLTREDADSLIQLLLKDIHYDSRRREGSHR